MLSLSVPIDEQSSSSLTSKEKGDDASSSLDLEWEHEAGWYTVDDQGGGGLKRK